MSGLLQDVRYALRQLRKSPGFTAVAAFTLGLGIGANLAIFGLLDQALLRSLPVKEPDRLVLLRYSGSDTGHLRSRSDNNLYFSYPRYRDLRDRNSVSSGVFATNGTQAGLQGRNQPELVATELVSGNYFDVLGVQPALGRLFVVSDDTVPNGNPVAVLSVNDGQGRFAGDHSIQNQGILVNGHPFTVIGMAQRGFHCVVMGDTPDLFAPMTINPGHDLEMTIWKTAARAGSTSLLG